MAVDSLALDQALRRLDDQEFYDGLLAVACAATGSSSGQLAAGLRMRASQGEEPPRTLQKLKFLGETLGQVAVSGHDPERVLQQIADRVGPWLRARLAAEGEREAVAKRDQLLHALDGIGDGIVVFDADERLVSSNPEYRARFEGVADRLVPGITLEEMVDLYYEQGPGKDTEDADGRKAEMLGAYRMESGTFETSMGERWFRLRTRPTASGGRVTMRMEVTDERRVQAELRQARDSAQQAAGARSMFLTTMSHEIRTPMNGVLGMAELLSDTRLDGEQKTLVETIRSSGDLLLTIIDDILEFSRLDAGRISISSIPTTLNTLARESAELLMSRARGRGIRLTYTVDEVLPERVMADPIRLKQVLLNLLGNAVKFTPNGEVVLSVRRHSGRLQFEVRDTGIGIAKESIDNLFRPFMQADASTTRKYGGTGLGLAISQGLVTRMGGTLQVESEVGMGSRFFFSIPLRPGPGMMSRGDEPTDPIAVQRAMALLRGNGPREMSLRDGLGPSPDLTQGDGARILVAEDNAINQRVIAMLLRLLGHNPELVANGREAVEALASGRYDLVLMDCLMPEMDGLEATRRIRAFDRQTPIIAVTANVLDADRERCRLSGMTGFLSKPVERATLETTLRIWLARAARASESA